jgi:hypothetical protein
VVKVSAELVEKIVLLEALLVSICSDRKTTFGMGCSKVAGSNSADL